MSEPVIPERYKPLLEKRQLFCLRDILQDMGKTDAKVARLEADANDALNFSQAESDRYEAALDVLESKVEKQAAIIERLTNEKRVAVEMLNAALIKQAHG